MRGHLTGPGVLECTEITPSLLGSEDVVKVYKHKVPMKIQNVGFVCKLSGAQLEGDQHQVLNSLGFRYQCIERIFSVG